MGINKSATRNFIKEEDMNASSSGINELQKQIDKFAKDIVKKAKTIAIDKKKKTISDEHIKLALAQ